MHRALGIAGAFMSTLAGLLGAGYYRLLRRPLAQTQGVARLEGLQQEVEIVRDRWGVPHIYAANLPDLMFAQGYVHAQDRLWQMDFQRRLAAGRLAEIFGRRALDVDRWLRILGLRRVAEQEAAHLDGELREELKAYAAGVNARIREGRLPTEFTLLAYRPEPWSLADSLSWNKMISWFLSVNWESEIVRARLIACLGLERAEELEPAYFEHWPCIVPPEADYSQIGLAALERAEAGRIFTGPPARVGLGSNSWVIAGSRTTTGAPILANDMHLLMSVPAVWYENHLSGGDLAVTGVTFPGVPGVIAGHNGHVAWGFTNGFADVQDLYLERLRRSDDGRVQYEYNGEWHDASVVREEIHVRAGTNTIEEVIVTRHGPIMNALAPDIAQEQPLALRWPALEPDRMIRAMRNMNRARNCQEFREALRDWATPVLNVVYADTEGNVAYSFAGRVPLRGKTSSGLWLSGQVPVPGWKSDYEWQGFIPFDELPHITNPADGYVATANNCVIADDYPYPILIEQMMGDRAQRIVELIEARAGNKVDVAYIQHMQFDQVSPTAQIVAHYLGQLPLPAEEPELAEVVRLMWDWDGHLSPDSPAAAVYEVFTRRMLHLTLADKLCNVFGRYTGQEIKSVLGESAMLSGRAWEWLQETLAAPDSHWFDRGHGEHRDDVMRLALRETVDWLKGKCGPRVEDWAWGKLHQLSYRHVLGEIRPLDRLFNRGPFPLGGDGSTIWATGTSRSDLVEMTSVGPPFRFIADLGDLSRSWGLLSPGQSGQLGSRHYDDQIEAWFTAGYHPMPYESADVERAAEARLVLQPK